jgi:hypothetical protein
MDADDYAMSMGLAELLDKHASGLRMKEMVARESRIAELEYALHFERETNKAVSAANKTLAEAMAKIRDEAWDWREKGKRPELALVNIRQILSGPDEE